MRKLFCLSILTLFLFSCQTNDRPSDFATFGLSGKINYNYYSGFFVCDGKISSQNNFTVKLCRIYITIKDVNSTELVLNSSFLDPPDLQAPGGTAIFAVRFDDAQKAIWNKMDRTKTAWEVKYEK
jgi:hypothetical protein